MKKYILEFVETDNKNEKSTFETYGLPKLKLVTHNNEKFLVYEIRLVEHDCLLQLNYRGYMLNAIYTQK